VSIIADTSYIYALFNPRDRYHRQTLAFAEVNTEPILFPSAILPELGFVFERDRGYAGIVWFLDQFRHTDAHIEPMIQEDLGRIYEIAAQYADSRVDVVDCCIIAVAERLQITKIATFDRRDFHIVRPVHTDYFEIVP